MPIEPFLRMGARWTYAVARRSIFLCISTSPTSCASIEKFIAPCHRAAPGLSSLLMLPMRLRGASIRQRASKSRHHSSQSCHRLDDHLGRSRQHRRQHHGAAGFDRLEALSSRDKRSGRHTSKPIFGSTAGNRRCCVQQFHCGGTKKGGAALAFGAGVTARLSDAASPYGAVDHTT